MEVTDSSAAAIAVTPVKKVAKSKSKARSAKAYHPSTANMVNAAIKELKDRKGSSLQAIKKYVSTTYNVDGNKLSPFIKRYLKTALSSGAVVQTSGKGASGSFKLSVASSGAKAKEHSQRKKPTRATDVAKMAAKKPVAVKKRLGKKPAALKRNAKPSAAIKIRSGLVSISEAKNIVKRSSSRCKAPKPKVIVRKSRKTGRK